jgi:hypothetical protein
MPKLEITNPLIQATLPKRQNIKQSLIIGKEAAAEVEM